MMLYKVKVGSLMNKAGIRWTESFQPGASAMNNVLSLCMVLDYILTISMIILVVFMITIIDHSVTLVLLIISQVLGHMNFNKISQLENNMNLISMNQVKIIFLVSVLCEYQTFICDL